MDGENFMIFMGKIGKIHLYKNMDDGKGFTGIPILGNCHLDHPSSLWLG